MIETNFEKEPIESLEANIFAEVVCPSKAVVTSSEFRLGSNQIEEIGARP